MQEIADKKLCMELTGGTAWAYENGHDWDWCMKGLGYRVSK